MSMFTGSSDNVYPIKLNQNIPLYDDPPQNPDAEAGLVASMLIYPGEIGTIREKVRVEYFLNPILGEIFSTCLAVADKGEVASFASVFRYFQNRDKVYENILRVLDNMSVADIMIPTMINVVIDLYSRREQIAVLNDVIVKLRDQDPNDPPNFLPEINDKISKLPVADTANDDVVLYEDAGNNIGANMLVRGWLTEAGLSCVFGPPNCGKSFFATDLACRVAQGLEWHGLRTKKGAVVYVALEAANDVELRIKAFRKEIGEPKAPLALLTAAIDLSLKGGDISRIISAMDKVSSEENPPRLVVIDTLSRAMVGGDENNPKDMTAVYSNCARITKTTGAHVMIIHHTGKDASRGARGHSSLKAAVDNEIEVERADDGKTVTVTCTKQRGAERPPSIAFNLRSINMGQDDEGETLASCICEPVDMPKPSAGEKPSGQAGKILEILNNTVAKYGEWLSPSNGMPMVNAVKRAVLRAEVAQSGALSDNIDDPKIQHRLRTLLPRLEEQNLIGYDVNYVWLLPKK